MEYFIVAQDNKDVIIGKYFEQELKFIRTFLKQEMFKVAFQV